LKEIDGSLQRLNADHVDLYQMHWMDHATPIEETMETLKSLVAAGKVRYIGASNFSLSEIARADAIHPVAAHQALYNMFDRNSDSYCGIPLEYAAEREILPDCAQNGRAFIPYSPLCQGVLSGRFYRGRDRDLKPGDMRLTNPEILGEKLDRKLDVVELLKKLADEAGLTLLELAMGWLLKRPGVTTIISGSRTVEQAESGARCGDLEISDDVFARATQILDENGFN